MQRTANILLVTVLILSLPVAADVRNDLRRVHRECEDKHKKPCAVSEGHQRAVKTS